MMTDNDLTRIINDINEPIRLGCLTLFPDDDMSDKTARRSVFGDQRGISCTLTQARNTILGVILKAHKIAVKGNAFVFYDIQNNMDEFIVDYNYAIQQHLADYPEKEEGTKIYHLTTVYTVDADLKHLEIPGFHKINIKSIATIFESTIKQALTERNYSQEFIENYPKENYIYINEANNMLIRITNNMITSCPKHTSNFEHLANYRYDNACEHIFLALLPVLVPALKEQFSEDEINLFKEFTHPFKFNVSVIKNLLRTIFTTELYTTLIKERKLKELKDSLMHEELNMYDSQIQEVQSEIERKVSALETLEKNLANLNKEKLIASVNTENIDEKIEYLFNHPYILNIIIDHATLYIKARTPLSMWDPDAAETVIKNLERIMTSTDVVSDYKKYITFFFKRVFIEQDVTYWMTNRFEVNIRNYGWQYSCHNNIYLTEYINNLAAVQAGYNPHIEHYNCQGTHRVEIQRAKEHHDLIALIEALLNPLKNMNLTDGVVVNTFIKDSLQLFINNNIPCLEYESKMYTIQDLYDLMENQNTIEVQDAVRGEMNEIEVQDTHIGEVEEPEENEEEI